MHHQEYMHTMIHVSIYVFMWASMSFHSCCKDRHKDRVAINVIMFVSQIKGTNVQM